MRFAPHTDDDVREMLAALGLASLDDLFDQIPPAVRLGRDWTSREGLSEMELVARPARAGRRATATLDDLVCFAGGGAYDHYVPAVVWALAGRSELYTSYTPYQPEVSQGVLQALFEYQSMICDLTALEVSNASLYDGATALVEAVNMARARHAAATRVLVSEAVDPRYWEALRTYGRGTGYRARAAPASRDGRRPACRRRSDDDVAAVVRAAPERLRHPRAGARAVRGRARGRGARTIQVFDPLSLGVLAPPGRARRRHRGRPRGRSLGNHLAYGGPYLGHHRGADAGRPADARADRRARRSTSTARPGYVLTLQAREQHIRREKATSNICTNQTLMAVAATIYLAWLGPAGSRSWAGSAHAKAALRGRAAGRRSPASALAFPDAPFFKEFARADRRGDPPEVQRGLIDARVPGGPGARWRRRRRATCCWSR